MGSGQVMAYVDGFNLYHSLRSFGDGSLLWLDVEKLVRGFVQPENRLERIHYFTARIGHRPASYRRQDAYLRALRYRSTQLDVHEVGSFRVENEQCIHCEKKLAFRREKESDVALATRMIADAASGAMDLALLVSGDTDFTPAVQVSKGLGVPVLVALPPGRNSRKLGDAASGSFHIQRSDLAAARLPDVVIGRRGQEIPRPAFHLPDISHPLNHGGSSGGDEG